MPSVRIEPFSSSFAPAFRELNEEWLERYFEVEPVDARVLADPEAYILASGGEIFFALDAHDVLGTCAIRAESDGRFELTKMAVTARAQGRGIGRLLLTTACDWFRQRDGKLLFLESHSSLGAALRLYESAGFEHRERPFASEYLRSDVYMEWRGPALRDSD